jgi:hypothetical protein
VVIETREAHPVRLREEGGATGRRYHCAWLSLFLDGPSLFSEASSLLNCRTDAERAAWGVGCLRNVGRAFEKSDEGCLMKGKERGMNLMAIPRNNQYIHTQRTPEASRFACLDALIFAVCSKFDMTEVTRFCKVEDVAEFSVPGHKTFTPLPTIPPSMLSKC